MNEPEAPPESDRLAGYPHPRQTRRLFGQMQAEARFLDAWHSGRLHHAWLLQGPQGVGKATFAYRAARALISQPTETGLFGEASPDPETLDAPDDCPVQTRIEAQAEPRLFVLRRQWDMDRKRFQTQITVDHVRALRKFLQMSAADGGWRAVIVDAADEMNRNSANALLKYLEEPPPQTIFMLLSHAPAGLLPTIRSRCRTLNFAPLAAAPLAEALDAAGAEIPAGAATALAELSGGSAGRALRLVASDGLAVYGALVRTLQAGRGVDRPAMLQLASAMGGAANADRYAAVLSLTQLLLSRLAKAGAMGVRPPEAADGEHQLMQTVASHPAQGRIWADTLAGLAATTRHAVSVNLDPQQCVIDMFLEIDATLGRVRAVAA